MRRDWIGTIRRGLKKPPRIIIERVASEMLGELDRIRAPFRSRLFTQRRLLRGLAARTLDDLWGMLGSRAYPAQVISIDPIEYDEILPGDRDRIMEAAERALRHEVNLLGSGFVDLGNEIDWLKDYKTGYRWELAYIRSIDYNNPARPSDVKFAWEVSRLQWLIPAGQAYLLTGDERYADEVRRVFEHWIEENPYARSVNWACTMEVALRIFTWTWLFHVFKGSVAWQEEGFRGTFLRTLYLHGEFTERNLERSDINGNHYTADAAGLVFAGLFFGDAPAPRRWLKLGWSILCEELPRQVYDDGVDFEMSTAYHRLVLELFLLPVLFRERAGLDVPQGYRDRVIAMTKFVEAYTQPDGRAPLWGDADDARALPFGSQHVNDHRYLIGLVGQLWNVEDLNRTFTGPTDEVFWLLGSKACRPLKVFSKSPVRAESREFPDGGVYVMRSGDDHVFIDCGPVGLGGRGGHGHNDCLSFEAVLCGKKLISDCGAYLYTASYTERNLFRSTSYHNTPQIEGKEINRFIRPDYLWNLHYDAEPVILEWDISGEKSLFRGTHTGFERIRHGVRHERTIELNHAGHALRVNDSFQGSVDSVIIPLHLAPGVSAEFADGRKITLVTSDGSEYELEWSGGNFDLSFEVGYVSPSYGVRRQIAKLVWRGDVAQSAVLECRLSPVSDHKSKSSANNQDVLRVADE